MERPVPPNVPPKPPTQDRRRLATDLLTLTSGEVVALVLMARGQTNVQIARSLHISPFTVKNRVEAIYAKLNAHNRANAVARGFLLGALTSESLDNLPD